MKEEDEDEDEEEEEEEDDAGGRGQLASVRWGERAYVDMFSSLTCRDDGEVLGSDACKGAGTSRGGRRTKTRRTRRTRTRTRTRRQTHDHA